jgi:hypothetical protein
VFNPVTQAEKFDPQARYISRWVPELAALPVKARFAPWQHPLLLAAHARAIRVRRWWIWPPAAMPRWPPTASRGRGKARAERSSQLAERGPVGVPIIIPASHRAVYSLCARKPPADRKPRRTS